MHHFQTRALFPNIVFRKIPKMKSLEVLLKNLVIIFWKLNFSNFSEVNPKTNFISQLQVSYFSFGV